MAGKVNKGRIISVVAGGWSFLEVDQSKIPGTIIAINDSAVHLTAPYQVALSMDRLWTEHRWPFIVERQKCTYLRKAAVQNIADVEHVSFVKVFACNHESVNFTGDKRVLNGTNSATCGLALAHALAPEELFLYGFDMCKGPNGEAHWFPDYPWAQGGATSPGKFNAWAMEFNIIAKQFKQAGVRVVNVSSRSMLNCFQKEKPQALGMAA